MSNAALMSDLCSVVPAMQPALAIEHIVKTNVKVHQIMATHSICPSKLCSYYFSKTAYKPTDMDTRVYE